MSQFVFAAGSSVQPPNKPPDVAYKISFRDKVLGNKVPSIARAKTDLLEEKLN
ncbi:hypothetical protein SESBI_43725 [Sesbania bispinosa]|nr:hypothetical protein SESBI_43725 [Sesbania bispinosa]